MQLNSSLELSCSLGVSSCLLGDLDYLPSIEPGVFGRVSFVENEPTQPEQYGYISPNISLSSVYMVAVGRLSQISQSPEVVDQTVAEIISESLKVDNISIGNVGSTSSSTLIESENVDSE